MLDTCELPHANKWPPWEATYLFPKPLCVSLWGGPPGEATHFFEHLGVVSLPSSRVDLISGNCPRLFQPNAGKKVGDGAKEWNMQACQGQDACLKHWMNWNCTEKCGFVINLRNFISCVSLIGDNSHLMFKPRPDGKKQNKKLQLCKTNHISQEPVV